MGPAITDAAEWYEAFDLVGLVCTPNTYQHILTWGSGDGLWNDFLNFELIAKGDKSSREYLCYDWPAEYVKSIHRGLVSGGEMDGLAAEHHEKYSSINFRRKIIRFLRTPMKATDKLVVTNSFIDKSLCRANLKEILSR